MGDYNIQKALKGANYLNAAQIYDTLWCNFVKLADLTKHILWQSAVQIYETILFISLWEIYFVYIGDYIQKAL